MTLHNRHACSSAAVRRNPLVAGSQPDNCDGRGLFARDCRIDGVGPIGGRGRGAIKQQYGCSDCSGKRISSRRGDERDLHRDDADCCGIDCRYHLGVTRRCYADGDTHRQSGANN